MMVMQIVQIITLYVILMSLRLMVAVILFLKPTQVLKIIKAKTKFTLGLTMVVMTILIFHPF